MPNMNPPDFKLTLGSLDFSTEKLKTRVNEIEIEQVSDGASAFKIVLDDRDNYFSNEANIKEGDSCVIELGYFVKGRPDTTKLIEGQVTSVKGHRREYTRQLFVVSGFDGLQALTRGRKRRSWENIKDSDLATLIAGEGGLGADVDDSKIIHPFVSQNNVNNLSFLYERAQRIGFEVGVKDKKLIFKKPQVQSSSCKLSWDGTKAGSGVSILRRLDFGSSTMGAVSKVVVRSYDPKTAAPIIGASSEILGEGMGRESAGARADRNNPSTVIQVSDENVASQEEAEALAYSILNRKAMQFVTGKGECEGDPRVQCGKKITVDDIGTEMDGEYYVTSAKHVLKAGPGKGFGYYTEFSIGRPAR
ncbi:MAG: hypothetical protein WC966_10935 [Bradymonadales bacterium]|jgi:phage protein D